MFVQIIEGRTRDAQALREQGEQWKRELRPGADGFLGATAGVTEEGRAITIVRFADEASARANSDRPEQSAWWEVASKLYDGEPTFTESSDTTEWMSGGSDDARFVQVMKTTGVDRAAVERMDAAMEPFMDHRPDILGGYRIWTGPDSCVDVAYFTNEAEARAGEQSEMPAELQEMLAEFSDMGETQYLDLAEPQLF